MLIINVRVDACFNGGTCENIYGGFVCHCPSGYYGDLCDYNQEKCLCPPGTSCLQLEGGSQCVADTNGNLLLIEKPVVSNIVSLDNTVNTLLEDPPVRFYVDLACMTLICFI